MNSCWPWVQYWTFFPHTFSHVIIIACFKECLKLRWRIFDYCFWFKEQSPLTLCAQQICNSISNHEGTRPQIRLQANISMSSLCFSFFFPLFILCQQQRDGTLNATAVLGIRTWRRPHTPSLAAAIFLFLHCHKGSSSSSSKHWSKFIKVSFKARLRQLAYLQRQ